MRWNFEHEELLDWMSKNLTAEDEVKKAIETFASTEIPKILSTISSDISSSENQGIEEIDWDINIVAGGKDLSKVSKWIAVFKIKSSTDMPI